MTTKKIAQNPISSELLEVIGRHTLPAPFEPKLEVLDPEVLDLTRWVATRYADTPNMLELRRRAELVLAMHQIAMQQAKRGAS